MNPDKLIESNIAEFAQMTRRAFLLRAVQGGAAIVLPWLFMGCATAPTPVTQPINHGTLPPTSVPSSVFGKTNNELLSENDLIDSIASSFKNGERFWQNPNNVNSLVYNVLISQGVSAAAAKEKMKFVRINTVDTACNSLAAICTYDQDNNLIMDIRPGFLNPPVQETLAQRTIRGIQQLAHDTSHFNALTATPASPTENYGVMGTYEGTIARGFYGDHTYEGQVGDLFWQTDPNNSSQVSTIEEAYAELAGMRYTQHLMASGLSSKIPEVDDYNTHLPYYLGYPYFAQFLVDANSSDWDQVWSHNFSAESLNAKHLNNQRHKFLLNCGAAILTNYGSKNGLAWTPEDLAGLGLACVTDWINSPITNAELLKEVQAGGMTPQRLQELGKQLKAKLA